jgi:hypothetical protein
MPSRVVVLDTPRPVKSGRALSATKLHKPHLKPEGAAHGRGPVDTSTDPGRSGETREARRTGSPRDADSEHRSLRGGAQGLPDPAPHRDGGARRCAGGEADLSEEVGTRGAGPATSARGPGRGAHAPRERRGWAAVSTSSGGRPPRWTRPPASGRGCARCRPPGAVGGSWCARWRPTTTGCGCSRGASPWPTSPATGRPWPGGGSTRGRPSRPPGPSNSASCVRQEPDAGRLPHRARPARAPAHAGKEEQT